jgi:hypothetical protein
VEDIDDTLDKIEDKYTEIITGEIEQRKQTEEQMQ